MWSLRCILPRILPRDARPRQRLDDPPRSSSRPTRPAPRYHPPCLNTLAPPCPDRYMVYDLADKSELRPLHDHIRPHSAGAGARMPCRPTRRQRTGFRAPGKWLAWFTCPHSPLLELSIDTVPDRIAFVLRCNYLLNSEFIRGFRSTQMESKMPWMRRGIFQALASPEAKTRR